MEKNNMKNMIELSISEEIAINGGGKSLAYYVAYFFGLEGSMVANASNGGNAGAVTAFK